MWYHAIKKCNRFIILCVNYTKDSYEMFDQPLGVAIR